MVVVFETLEEFARNSAPSLSPPRSLHGSVNAQWPRRGNIRRPDSTMAVWSSGLGGEIRRRRALTIRQVLGGARRRAFPTSML